MFARRFILMAPLATSMTPGFSLARFAQSKIKVVSASGMIADAAPVFSGDLVEVLALTGPGVDPLANRKTPF